MGYGAKRSVAITGASRGIGRATALLLARERFRVFAGVRQPADGDALRDEAGEALVPRALDFTTRTRSASPTWPSRRAWGSAGNMR